MQAVSTRSQGWDPHLPNDVNVSGEEIPYIQRQPGRDPELKVFRPTEEAEDELFAGYRRVQLVSQSLDLLAGRYPALQLIEGFCRFGELLNGVSEDISPYMPDIRGLHARAVERLLQERSSFPAFASFSKIQQVRMRLAQESLELRQEIDKLVQNLYNDEHTKDLIRYIKQSEPRSSHPLHSMTDRVQHFHPMGDEITIRVF